MQTQPTILIGICSGNGYRERRNAVRETWKKNLPPNINALFFVGTARQPDDDTSNPDTVILDARDTYQELPEKVLKFYQYALRHYDFDWLFKCDDDTYVAVDRLQQLLNPACQFIGNEWITKRHFSSGGAGYLVSRALLEKIVQCDIPPSGAEDVIFGNLAVKLGAVTHGTTRLIFNNKKYPTPNNNIITSHRCFPSFMRAVHINYKAGQPGSIYQVQHIRWQDNLLFYPEGTFKRANSLCSGQWRLTPDGQLTLNWYQWPEETVTWDGQQYKSHRMTLTRQNNTLHLWELYAQQPPPHV